MVRETLTACLIVRDEEQRLPAALASLAFCDELVVVDSESVDRTREIAAGAGAKVVVNPWPGFAVQRNLAVDHATSDWVLEVDADERVTPALRDEILAFLSGPPPEGCDICCMPSLELFLRRPLGPSAKYPKYRLRMFRRGTYRHDESRLVHEGLVPRGTVHAFEAPLEHRLADTWMEALHDAWTYARLEAGQTPPLGGPKAYAAHLVARPVAKFGYRAIVDGGWHDGWRGGVKIGLDCLSDAVVVARRMTGLAPDPPAPVNGTGNGHFGRPVEAHTGSPRVVALSAGAAQRDRALDWLAGARRHGADVGLITDAPPDRDAPGVQLRAIPHFGPIHLARALDAEVQRRVIDVLVLGPGRPTAFGRRLPGALRGPLEPASLDDDPSEVLTRVERELRA